MDGYPQFLSRQMFSNSKRVYLVKFRKNRLMANPFTFSRKFCLWFPLLQYFREKRKANPFTSFRRFCQWSPLCDIQKLRLTTLLFFENLPCGLVLCNILDEKSRLNPLLLLENFACGPSPFATFSGKS